MHVLPKSTHLPCYQQLPHFADRLATTAFCWCLIRVLVCGAQQLRLLIITRSRLQPPDHQIDCCPPGGSIWSAKRIDLQRSSSTKQKVQRRQAECTVSGGYTSAGLHDVLSCLISPRVGSFGEKPLLVERWLLLPIHGEQQSMPHV